MTQYKINGKELTEGEYIDLLNDLINLAKQGIPLDVNYTPIPASRKAVNITLPCGHSHELSYSLLRDWNFDMFSCNTPGCAMRITRELLQESLNKMNDKNIIDFYHCKEYYEPSNNTP